MLTREILNKCKSENATFKYHDQSTKLQYFCVGFHTNDELHG